MNRVQGELEMEDRSKPICPVTISIEPDGEFRAATIESRRVWVHRVSDGQSIGSVAVILRCVGRKECSDGDFEYVKAIGEIIRVAIARMVDNTTEMKEVAANIQRA